MVYIQLPLTGYWLHTMKAAIDTGIWLKLKYTVLETTDRCPDVDPGRTQENLSTLYNFVIKIMPAPSMNTCSLSHMRCTHGWPSCCMCQAVVQTDIELGVRGQTVFPLARLFSHCGKRAGASQLAFLTNHFLHTPHFQEDVSTHSSASITGRGRLVSQ